MRHLEKLLLEYLRKFQTKFLFSLLHTEPRHAAPRRAAPHRAFKVTKLTCESEDHLTPEHHKEGCFLWSEGSPGGRGEVGWGGVR